MKYNNDFSKWLRMVREKLNRIKRRKKNKCKKNPLTLKVWHDCKSLPSVHEKPGSNFGFLTVTPSGKNKKSCDWCSIFSAGKENIDAEPNRSKAFWESLNKRITFKKLARHLFLVCLILKEWNYKHKHVS